MLSVNFKLNEVLELINSIIFYYEILIVLLTKNYLLLNWTNRKLGKEIEKKFCKHFKSILTITIIYWALYLILCRKKEFEHLSESEAKRKIIAIDKERKEYYEHFTSQKWGQKENYELCIDTSVIGVEETINLLELYIKKRIQNQKKVNK